MSPDINKMPSPEGTAVIPIDLGFYPLDQGQELSGREPIDVGFYPLDQGQNPIDVGFYPLDQGQNPIDVGVYPPNQAQELLEKGQEPIEKQPPSSEFASIFPDEASVPALSPQEIAKKIRESQDALVAVLVETAKEQVKSDTVETGVQRLIEALETNELYSSCRAVNLFEEVKKSASEEDYSKMLEVLREQFDLTEEVFASLRKNAMKTTKDIENLEAVVKSTKEGGVTEYREKLLEKAKQTQNKEGEFDLSKLDSLDLYLVTMLSRHLIGEVEREEAQPLLKTAGLSEEDLRNAQFSGEALSKLPEDLKIKILEIREKEEIKPNDEEIKQTMQELATRIQKGELTLEEAFSLLRQNNFVYDFFFKAVFPEIVKLDVREQVSLIKALTSHNLGNETEEDKTVLQKHEKVVKYPEKEKDSSSVGMINELTIEEFEKMRDEEKLDWICEELDKVSDLIVDVETYGKYEDRYTTLSVLANYLIDKIAQDKYPDNEEKQDEEIASLFRKILLPPDILNPNHARRNDMLVQKNQENQAKKGEEIEKKLEQGEKIETIVKEEILLLLKQENIDNEDYATVGQEKSQPPVKRQSWLRKNSKKIFAGIGISGILGSLLFSSLNQRGEISENTILSSAQPKTPFASQVSENPFQQAAEQANLTWGNIPQVVTQQVEKIEQGGKEVSNLKQEFQNAAENVLKKSVTNQQMPNEGNLSEIPVPEKNNENTQTINFQLGHNKGEYPTVGHFIKSVASDIYGVDLKPGEIWSDAFNPVWNAMAEDNGQNYSTNPFRPEEAIEKLQKGQFGPKTTIAFREYLKTTGRLS